MGLVFILWGCSGDGSTAGTPASPSVGVAPAVVSANAVVTATAGLAFVHDATKGGTSFSGTGLTYSVSFNGDANGLSATNGIIIGVPASPKVMSVTITATDATGRTAKDDFRIVAFADGLLTPVLPATAYRYADAEVPFPAQFTLAPNGGSVASMDNVPATNPVTDAGAALGRVLFYDARVSANDAEACASCHVQRLGFSDTPKLSIGFAGGFTGRHSPGLANARFYKRGKYFWDERAPSLEAQVVRPIQDATEMGMTVDALVVKLGATSYYRSLFNAAFGSTEITSDRVALALSQFVRSMVSGNSRFDRAFAGAGPPNFNGVLTPQEQAGEQLFRGAAGCAACHATVAQISDSVHNNGLDAVASDTGAGRGTFKAPSLRNVAVRPRFMHDGRFTNLDQVVEFYDNGVQPSPGLDPRLRGPDGQPRRLGLSADQKASLVAFLGTLTDSTFLTDPRFANPFTGPVSTPVPTPVPGATTLAVTIQGIAYHPPTLTVTPGSTVTFTNLDGTRHSANFASPLIQSTPIFTSGTQTVRMPATVGTYNYQCAIHGAAMTGVIVVK